MKFCYEKREACCCAPVTNACVGFLIHFIIHGGVSAIFVFTTYTEPPLTWLDYAFVGTNIGLAGLSLISLFFVKMRSCQWWRVFLGLLFTVAVFSNILFTAWYSEHRWDAKMLTLAMKGINPRLKPPDPIWYMWLIFCWLESALSLYYLYCIVSLFCNSYSNHLFVSPYKSPFDEQLPNTRIEVNRYANRYEDYKPYPVQKH